VKYKKIAPVGIIAEDDSDIEVIKHLIHKVSGKDNIAVKKFVGKGCGKINRRCNAWANQLKNRGCGSIILVHDLDRNNLDQLYQRLHAALTPCPLEKHLICIPVTELESWLLSDPEAIRSSLALRNLPKIEFPPETIPSAKEYLGGAIHKASNGEVIYLNTKHNSKIVKEITVEIIAQKCTSFVPFQDFVRGNYGNPAPKKKAA
jgi:hypothetical protein